jgi:hypothetical protein
VANIRDVGPAIDETERIIRATPDEEARTVFSSGTLETLSTSRGPSARLDADNWAQIRADFAELKLPGMGGRGGGNGGKQMPSEH